MTGIQPDSPQHITLSIRNMVGKSCIQLVKQALGKISGIEVHRVVLGSADIKASSMPDHRILNEELNKVGFELLLDKTQVIVEQIKVAVLEMIYYGNNLNTIIRNSDYLSDKLGMPYAQLSKIFSEYTASTLEKYIILVRIERVKELLSYNEITLSEIAYQMGYSSVQYLSNQFRQVTGYSVSEYKTLPLKPRIPLDQLI